jgi:hypothetical protein
MLLETLLLLCVLLASIATAVAVQAVSRWPRKFSVHQYLEIAGDYDCVRDCARLLERARFD